MSALPVLARCYRHARTVSARRTIVRDLRACDDFPRLVANDLAFATLVGAPTFGAGENADESPVQLMLRAVIGERDLLTLAFQRYLTWAELLSIRAHPSFPPSSDAALLDQHWDGDRPLVRFVHWLTVGAVDWSALLDPAAFARRSQRVHGPATPLEPTWLVHLDVFVRRFRPEDRGAWLIRAAGIAGGRAIDRLDDLERVSGDEVDVALRELLQHPDAAVAEVARRLIARSK